MHFSDINFVLLDSHGYIVIDNMQCERNTKTAYFVVCLLCTDF